MLHTSGKVTLNEMVEDFHLNTVSKCWKFEEFSSLRVESCFFFFLCVKSRDLVTALKFVAQEVHFVVCRFFGTSFGYNTFWVASSINYK